jgi:predicted aspartyl protease
VGTFYVSGVIANHIKRTKTARVARLLVDTGSDYTWIPERILRAVAVAAEKRDLVFTMANGQTITRSVGFAIIRVNGHFTTDEVVFARPGDLAILGARTLEGHNLRVDAKTKKLVAGGPLLAGFAA